MITKTVLSLMMSAVFLTNCTTFGGFTKVNAETVKISDVAKDLTVEDESRETTVSAPNAAKSQTNFRKLTFNKQNLPKNFAYEGKILDGSKWIDANGENTLIVSQKDAKNGDGENVQNIYGYLYAVKNGATKQLWKIQDSATNYCDAGKGLVSPILAQDSDKNGIAENLFVYNVQGNCDVSPVSYKLMMHSGETKYAIRGATGIDIPNSKIKAEKNFDAAFDGAPKSYKQAASGFWDKYVTDFNAR